MTDRHAPYPVDPWVIRETAFDADEAPRAETVFALGNGHIGLRGNLEEAAGNVVHGTYVNGFHEIAPIRYPEPAHGYARNHQVLLNVADAKRIEVWADGEALDLVTGEVDAHERVLDLRAGELRRRTTWRTRTGAVLELESRRIVSLARRSIGAFEVRVSARSGPARIRLVSTLETRARNQVVADDPRVGTSLPDDALVTVSSVVDGAAGNVIQRTGGTRMALAAAVRHELRAPASDPGAGLAGAAATDDGLRFTFEAALAPGESVALTKVVAYVTTLDHAEGDLVAVADELAGAALAAGMAGLAGEQRLALERFWERADVEIDGDEALQQGVRYNLFSLLQAAGRDARTSLPAKGLTGEGYEGHYFWDTEIFALPFFTYTDPAAARSLLAFRVRTLPAARARAAELGHRGALYPWRTISGEEASAYFPAGTAQYHINADIAYAIERYLRATGDRSFLADGAAAVVLETARLWADLGSRIASRGGAFCINEVTGPDEYTALVNNNAYTNLMARNHLRFAASVADALAAEEPGLLAGLGVTADEVADWRDAADRMLVPRDERLGIHLQDDAFLDRAPWDFEGVPASDYPLLLHYHPLTIYRHQVLKQPDVVLAQVLLGHEFSAAEKRRNFDYYDPLTTGDSSLAPCIQSVAASELGYDGLAHRYFMRTARMDLDDVNGNVEHGVHIAAMAGTWYSLVYGFAGFRDDGHVPSFRPRLPAAWSRLAFRLRLGGSAFAVELRNESVTYAVVDGPPVVIEHFGNRIEVHPGMPVCRGLVPRLEAVILDLDGVLTNTSELHFRAWERLAREIGVPFDRTLNERLKGVSRLECLDIILAAAGSDVAGPERLVLAERKNGYFRELIGAIAPRDLLPGAGDLLAGLRARGVKTAIASMSHNVWDVVDRLGIRDAVDGIIDPAVLEKGKPDPEIFLAAADMLHVPAESCVGVEDAVAGIAAIRGARMRSVGVGEALPGADWTVRGLDEVTVEALERLVATGSAMDAGAPPAEPSAPVPRGSTGRA
jgi:beta-phosphoglucomutase